MTAAFAVGAAVEIAVDLAVEIAVELYWLVLWSSTVFCHLPRQCVEARRMSVEAHGKPTVARGVSAIVRGTPWTRPWNAVEVRGRYRGAQPKRHIM